MQGVKLEQVNIYQGKKEYFSDGMLSMGVLPFLAKHYKQTVWNYRD